MDKTIEELPYTDTTTKMLIQSVVDKKRKVRKFEKNYQFSVIIAFLFAILLFLNSFFLLNGIASNTLGEVYNVLFKDDINIYLLFFLIITFGWLKIIKAKLDKEEAEFHQLRMEVVSKNKDLWREEEAWKNRHLVYQQIKKQYDVNLFTENK